MFRRVFFLFEKTKSGLEVPWDQDPKTLLNCRICIAIKSQDAVNIAWHKDGPSWKEKWGIKSSTPHDIIDHPGRNCRYSIRYQQCKHSRPILDKGIARDLSSKLIFLTNSESQGSLALTEHPFSRVFGHPDRGTVSDCCKSSIKTSLHWIPNQFSPFNHQCSATALPLNSIQPRKAGIDKSNKVAHAYTMNAYTALQPLWNPPHVHRDAVLRNTTILD